MKMTASEYLAKRGWLYQPEGDGFDGGPLWIDAISTSELSTAADALTIQRARDAEKEREAWVAFAAARLAFGYGGSEYRESRDKSTKEAAIDADSMLALYRARFAVEVES